MALTEIPVPQSEQEPEQSWRPRVIKHSTESHYPDLPEQPLVRIPIKWLKHIAAISEQAADGDSVEFDSGGNQFLAVFRKGIEEDGWEYFSIELCHRSIL